jgi:hypothetical protein
MHESLFDLFVKERNMLSDTIYDGSRKGTRIGGQRSLRARLALLRRMDKRSCEAGIGEAGGPCASPSSELVLPMPLKVPQRTSSAYHQSLDPRVIKPILLQIPSIQLYISTHEPRSRLHRSFHLPYHPLSRPSSCQAAPNSSLPPSSKYPSAS